MFGERVGGKLGLPPPKKSKENGEGGGGGVEEEDEEEEEGDGDDDDIVDTPTELRLGEEVKQHQIYPFPTYTCSQICLFIKRFPRCLAAAATPLP